MNTLMPMFAAGSVSPTLTGLDWLVVGMYFCVLLGVAWWVVRRGKDTADDYFLAGRNLGWWVVGASIFASNIGSEHVVGLAGSGASDGVAMAHYELHAWCLLVLAWVFVPFYARSLVFTMPEFLERRFSTKSRYVLSVVSLITFVVSKIAVGIFAGGVVFSTLLPEVQIPVGDSFVIDSFWIGSIAVIVLTGLYTALGGMRAVAYNDAIQVVILILGSASLTVYGLIKLGGWNELRAACGSDMFNLWKPLTPAGVESTWAPVLETAVKDGVTVTTKQAWYFNGNFPWLGMLFCAPIIGLWYWCTDQYIVQRALGAPDQKTARRGSIFAAFLKLFPVYLFIIPGLICFALAKSYKVPSLSGATSFVADDFKVKELPDFAAKLKAQKDPVSQFVWSQMAEDTRKLATDFTPTANPVKLQRALAKDLSTVLASGSIFDAQRFAGITLSAETLKVQALLQTNTLAKAALLARQNRLLLEDAYPKELETGSMINKDGKGNARNSQGAFPMMVKHLLPPGLRGLVVAALLSALMGSLAGVFNACSTLFTVDLYQKWKPKASQHELVRTGRTATVVMVLIALAWIPVIQGAHGLYGYLQAVQGYLAPPIFVVFFFGVFWKRLNAQGCFWAMVVGFILGVFRMLVDTPVTMKLSGFENGYTYGSFWWIVNNINFQYFSVLITIVSAITMVVVSHMTQEPDYKQIKGLAFGTADESDRKATRDSWDWKEVAASVLVLVCILGAYLYFNG